MQMRPVFEEYAVRHFSKNCRLLLSLHVEDESGLDVTYYDYKFF